MGKIYFMEIKDGEYIITVFEDKIVGEYKELKVSVKRNIEQEKEFKDNYNVDMTAYIISTIKFELDKQVEKLKEENL